MRLTKKFQGERKRDDILCVNFMKEFVFYLMCFAYWLCDCVHNCIDDKRWWEMLFPALLAIASLVLAIRSWRKLKNKE